jgi:uroporphyrinogen-III synthase
VQVSAAILTIEKQISGAALTRPAGAESLTPVDVAIELTLPEAAAPKTTWSDVPLYTVGQTSIDVLHAASADRNLSGLVPKADLTARSAADLIPALLARALDPTISAPEPAVSPKRYLFVRGDKSLETIQPALRDGGHTVHEVEVYRTGPSASLQRDVDNTLGYFISNITDAQPTVWLAFFSPSSAQYVLDCLPSEVVSAISSTASGDATAVRLTRVVAIGQTTRAFLQQRGIRTDAVARTPDAAGLAQAITSHR